VGKEIKNVLKALVLLKEKYFDAGLLDVQMPVIDGYLSKPVRADEMLKQLAIVYNKKL
jgi:CheY-like chemotaxis protein